MTNLKAVIPVAGLGMHMLPATKAIPKEMLPIVRQTNDSVHCLTRLWLQGIKEIPLGNSRVQERGPKPLRHLL